MKKQIKSIAVVIMVITATILGLTACHNKNCKKGDEKCEKASCCKDEKCCDKCSDKCTTDNKCCDKCKMGEEKPCCKKDSASCTKDSASMSGMGEKKACCEKDMKKATGMYACPMHKEISSDKPGKCSECNMEMEKK